MRLIGTFQTEKEAYSFYSFLLKEGIQNIYELAPEEKMGEKQYRIWVYDEEDLQAAEEWLKAYRENPRDPRFLGLDAPTVATPPSPNYSEVSASEDEKWQTVPPRRASARFIPFTFTNLIIILCAFLFLWDDFQEAQIVKDKGVLAAEIGMTPLEKDFLFDDPSSYRYIQEMIDTVPLNSYKEMKDLPPEATSFLKQAEAAPSWRGIYEFFVTVRTQGWAAAEATPLFEKIRQGEVWRLFTPCLLHRDFLHILFNMAWVWILVKQIEARLPKAKILILILLIGILSNLAQYFASGPYFLGFSGVVVGLAGFIWVRQKRAPWEGYPLQRSTFLFLVFFVGAMFLIEVLSFGLQLFSVIQLSPNIANTAHIAGGLTGMLLGRFSFFGRRIG